MLLKLFTSAALAITVSAGAVNAAPDESDLYIEEDDTVITAYACTKDRHLAEGRFRMVPSHSDMVRLHREIPDRLMKQSAEQAWSDITASLMRNQMEAPEHAKLSRRVMSKHVDKLEREFEARSGGITLYVYEIQTRFLYDSDQTPSPGCD